MKTFNDIINLGNAADLAGAPLVNNWPQMRGGFYILGRAAGGIDRVHIDNFVSRFPKDYEALDSMTMALLPSKSAYVAARMSVVRVFGTKGGVN